MAEVSGIATEPFVLRHSFGVLLVGALAAILSFGAVFVATGGSEFKPRFETGLRAATGVAALTAGLLTWARLELSRREHHLARDAEAHRFAAEQHRQAELLTDRQVARARDLTDQFGRALAQLGSETPVIRVGGLLALERYALGVTEESSRAELEWTMALQVLAAMARASSAAAVDVATEAVEAVRILGRFADRSGFSVDIAFDLRKVRLQGADLRGASLRHSNLAGADLSRTVLTGAQLQGATLDQANMDDASLVGAVMANSSMVGASLTRAVLDDAVLAGANLAHATAGRASLKRADLRGADLEGAELAGSDLTGADLTGAILSHAILDGAILTGTAIDGAGHGGAASS